MQDMLVGADVMVLFGDGKSGRSNKAQQGLDAGEVRCD
jgi:hypothetical protein